MINIDFDNFMFIANFIGIVAFAISGFFKAQKYDLDLFGALILGVCVSIGGGITRDLLLNRRPIIFDNPLDLYTACVTVIAIFLYYKLFSKQHSRITKYKSKLVALVMIFDAIGLAVFTIIGSYIAISISNKLLTVIICALVTGVGGGVIRDVLVSEIPIILKEDIYASLTILGSIIIFYFNKFHYNRIPVSLFVFFLILIIRLIIIKYKFNLPRTYK